MWKKLLPVMLSLALLAGLAGCGPVPEDPTGGPDSEIGTPADGQGPEQEEPVSQIANPIRPVDGPEDFAELGYAVYAPDGASDAEYSIIDGEIPIAQVTFTLDGARYTYRSALTEADISGLYVNYAEESTGIAICGEYWSLELDVKPIVDGGFAGFWSQDGVASTLYTPDAVEQTTFTSLCETLAEYDWLHRSEEHWYPVEQQTMSADALDVCVLTASKVTADKGTFALYNSGSTELTYGDAYSLEKQVNGVWCAVPPSIMETENFGWGFNDIGYGLAPGDEATLNLDWTWLYGQLTPGGYRLVKTATPDRGETVTVSAEFLLR